MILYKGMRQFTALNLVTPVGLAFGEGGGEGWGGGGEGGGGPIC